MDKTYTSLYRWDNGIQTPSSSDIRVLAQILCVGVDEISNLKELPINRLRVGSMNYGNDISSDSKLDLILKKYKNNSNVDFESFQKLKKSNIVFKKTNNLLLSNINRYSNVLNEMPLICYVKGPDLKYKYVNREFMLLAGCNHADDIIGKESLEIFKCRESQKILDYEKKSISEKIKLTDIEIKLPGNDKSRVGILTLAPIFDEHSEVSDLFVFIGDISHYSHIRKKYSLLQNILAKNDEVFFIHSRKNFISLSDSIKKLTGFSSEAFFFNRISFSDIIHLDDLKKMNMQNRLVLRPGKFNFRIMCADKGEKYIHADIYRHTNIEDNNNIFYGIIRELKERKVHFQPENLKHEV
ncbi:MAG: PAS domain-containing protein [bacterium]|nr:PAS domain-containing protein [bacterium]